MSNRALSKLKYILIEDTLRSYRDSFENINSKLFSTALELTITYFSINYELNNDFQQLDSAFQIF
jgi:hypothetical protein